MDKWILYAIVAVLALLLLLYLVVGIVSWLFKAVLVAFFFLFVYVLFKMRRRIMH